MNKDVGLFIICLIIGGLVPLMLIGADFYTKEVQEVQLYDTYYVFNPFHFALATEGLTLFFSFLIRGILTKFRGRVTLIFFGLGTIITGLAGVRIYQIMNAP